MIFVVHNFGDKANTFLFINIVRDFYWCMHFFISDFTRLTLEFRHLPDGNFNSLGKYFEVKLWNRPSLFVKKRSLLADLSLYLFVPWLFPDQL